MWLLHNHVISLLFRPVFKTIIFPKKSHFHPLIQIMTMTTSMTRRHLQLQHQQTTTTTTTTTTALNNT